MANLTLVYGMRLLPADEITAVGDAPVTLKNGNEAHVTMHVLEGSREQIEAIAREDPFHQHGLADFRVIEFRASQRADDIQSRIDKT